MLLLKSPSMENRAPSIRTRIASRSKAIFWSLCQTRMIRKNQKSFFFILNAKIYNNILPITLPTKLLYDTTKTLPGGAICHDYPLAFNINLKKEKKNTSKYTTKYKMLNIRRKLFYKQILKPVSH